MISTNKTQINLLSFIFAIELHNSQLILLVMKWSVWLMFRYQVNISNEMECIMKVNKKEEKMERIELRLCFVFHRCDQSTILKVFETFFRLLSLKRRKPYSLYTHLSHGYNLWFFLSYNLHKKRVAEEIGEIYILIKRWKIECARTRICVFSFHYN